MIKITLDQDKIFRINAFFKSYYQERLLKEYDYVDINICATNIVGIISSKCIINKSRFLRII